MFESARRLARWHYQWIVTHEFIPAIVGQTMSDSVYKEVPTGAPKITLKYYKPTNRLGRSFIPVEFAVAAYRFGHSITRPRYTVRDVFDSAGTLLGSVSGVPLFQDTASDNNLNGHRELLPRLKIQWSKFFNVAGQKPTARPVRQFDASLADPLFKMPTTALPDTNTLGLLSQRNLRRGRKMGLPSGQQVARLMGVTPLTPTQLWTNHRIEVEIPIVGNVVKVLNEYNLSEPEPQRNLRGSRMGRRGTTVVLHPERGRDRRPGSGRSVPSAGGLWPRFSLVCCRRTLTPTCT